MREIAVVLMWWLALHGPAYAQLDGRTLKIGLILDFSGPSADFAGQGSLVAAQMAVGDFGGSVLGRPIEVIASDHGNKPELAARSAREWFDEQGVEAVMDVANFLPALAANEIAKVHLNDELAIHGQRTTSAAPNLVIDAQTGTVRRSTAEIASIDSPDFTGAPKSGGIEIGYRDMPRVTAGLDRGKVYAASSAVTIEPGSRPGSTYMVYNDSNSSISIHEGRGLTLRWAGHADTGSRNLAPHGFVSVWFNSADEAIIHGAGLL